MGNLWRVLLLGNHLNDYLNLFYYRVFSLLLVLADIVIVIVDLATAGHVQQVNDKLSSVVTGSLSKS